MAQEHVSVPSSRIIFTVKTSFYVDSQCMLAHFGQLIQHLAVMYSSGHTGRALDINFVVDGQVVALKKGNTATRSTMPLPMSVAAFSE